MGLDTRGSCRVDPTADPATRLLLLCWCMAWHGMAWDGMGRDGMGCASAGSAMQVRTVSECDSLRRFENTTCAKEGKERV
jgi:hypothetical protein